MHTFKQCTLVLNSNQKHLKLMLTHCVININFKCFCSICKENYKLQAFRVSNKNMHK